MHIFHAVHCASRNYTCKTNILCLTWDTPSELFMQSFRRGRVSIILRCFRSAFPHKSRLPLRPLSWRDFGSFTINFRSPPSSHTYCRSAFSQLSGENAGKSPQTLNSGKGKAHKHKHQQIFPVTARVGGVSPDRVATGLPTGGQGSKVCVLCAEPKEHKHFRPGTRPGGSVTVVTEKLFMCQMFMCLFRPLLISKSRVSHLVVGFRLWWFASPDGFG